MKITATTTFLHGTDRFEDGQEYEVPDALGGYFVGNGWAKTDDAEIDVVLQPQNVTLQVDNAVHESSSEVAGG